MDFPGEKLVIKMWQSFADNGIGSLLKPWQIKREGLARNEVRRDELLMLAQTKRVAADVSAGITQFSSDGTLRLAPRNRLL